MFDPVRSSGRWHGETEAAAGEEGTMREVGWLVLAIVVGILAAVGWVARERWIMRRRRR